MRTQYQIVCIMPVYCAFTDANIGSKARRLPMTYFSEALARKLAGRMSDENRAHHGDDIFLVCGVYESAYCGVRLNIRSPIDATELPF